MLRRVSLGCRRSLHHTFSARHAATTSIRLTKQMGIIRGGAMFAKAVVSLVVCASCVMLGVVRVASASSTVPPADWTNEMVGVWNLEENGYSDRLNSSTACG